MTSKKIQKKLNEDKEVQNNFKEIQKKSKEAQTVLRKI